MSGARPWLRSESIRSFVASSQTTIPPSPVVICLLA